MSLGAGDAAGKEAGVTDQEVTLSVVAPVMNEMENIGELVERVDQAVGDLGVTWELVLVDDGSSDGTWDEIVGEATEREEVRGLSLSRNFGHQNALFAGLRHASGKAIVSLDGDLQHPPEVIPRLFEEWRDGAQIVKTRRIASSDSSWFKRFTSRWFYRIFSVLSGLPAQEGASDFRLVDRAVVAAITKMRDPDLFLRGMVDWVGFETTTVSYKAQPRAGGQSKYDLKRMFRFATSAVVSFSVIPLKLALWIGFLTGGFSFVMIVYGIVRFFQGETVPGWASIVTFSALMFGMLFVVLGIIGLYLGSIHEAVKNRPRYLVEKGVNGEFTEPVTPTSRGLLAGDFEEEVT